MNGNGGSVINLSSVVAKTPPAAASVYSATKGAVDVITVRSLRNWAQENPLNSLSLGLTKRKVWRTSEGETKRSARSRSHVRHWAGLALHKTLPACAISRLRTIPPG